MLRGCVINSKNPTACVHPLSSVYWCDSNPNTSSHLVVKFKFDLVETSVPSHARRGWFHLFHVTVRNIVCDHKHASNSIYLSWHPCLRVSLHRYCGQVGPVEVSESFDLSLTDLDTVLESGGDQKKGLEMSLYHRVWNGSKAGCSTKVLLT